MKKAFTAFMGFIMFFSAVSAEAAEFIATKKGLPSLVMLSTPT
jgi:hypothetical protein